MCNWIKKTTFAFRKTPNFSAVFHYFRLHHIYPIDRPAITNNHHIPVSMLTRILSGTLQFRQCETLKRKMRECWIFKNIWQMFHFSNTFWLSVLASVRVIFEVAAFANNYHCFHWGNILILVSFICYKYREIWHMYRQLIWWSAEQVILVISRLNTHTQRGHR